MVASGRDVTGTNGVRQQLIDAWNRREQRTGSQYRARLVELPGSADEQRSQLLGALQSRSAEYDVVNLDVTWVPEFAEAGLVRALPDDVVDEDVIASVAETARWDGKVYAVPFNSDVGLLYYRRDLMRRAGVEEPYVPEGFTWDRLRGHVETLHAKLPGAFANGWTTQLAAYEGRTVNAVEAFASAVPGLELVDGKGRYTGTWRSSPGGGGAAPPHRAGVHAAGRGRLRRGGRDQRLRQGAHGLPAGLALRLPDAVPGLRGRARGGPAARAGGARRAEPGGVPDVAALGQGDRADPVSHRAGERTLSAGGRVRGDPGLRLRRSGALSPAVSAVPSPSPTGRAPTGRRAGTGAVPVSPTRC